MTIAFLGIGILTGAIIMFALCKAKQHQTPAIPRWVDNKTFVFGESDKQRLYVKCPNGGDMLLTVGAVKEAMAVADRNKEDFAD